MRNYYEVNSDYGTMEDFQSMLATCHEYGIEVIMDLVVNHCSWSNVWFQEALKGPTLLLFIIASFHFKAIFYGSL